MPNQLTAPACGIAQEAEHLLPEEMRTRAPAATRQHCRPPDPAEEAGGVLMGTALGSMLSQKRRWLLVRDESWEQLGIWALSCLDCLNQAESTLHLDGER